MGVVGHQGVGGRGKSHVVLLGQLLHRAVQGAEVLGKGVSRGRQQGNGIVVAHQNDLGVGVQGLQLLEQGLKVGQGRGLALGADLRDFTGSAEIGLDSGFYPADSSDVILRLDEQKQDTAAGVYSELVVEFFDNSGDDEELIYSLKCGAYVPGGGAVG